MKTAPALALLLVACASNSPPPSQATNEVSVAPGPPATSQPMSEPCPVDIDVAKGQPCSFEGQGCGGDVTPNQGILCTDGVWVEGAIPTPPCCKE